jgi:hypothetical protein
MEGEGVIRAGDIYIPGVVSFPKNQQLLEELHQRGR